MLIFAAVTSSSSADHSQRGGLAAARRADERNDSPGSTVRLMSLYRDDPAGEFLAYRLQDDAAHSAAAASGRAAEHPADVAIERQRATTAGSQGRDACPAATSG